MARLKFSLMLFAGSLSAIGCAHAAPPSSDALISVPARTEFEAEVIEKVGPGFWLRVIESADLPFRYTDRIREYYPSSGRARLPGGRCIKFVLEPRQDNGSSDRQLIGAQVALDPSLCEELPPQGNASAAMPCVDSSRSGLMGGWRLTCAHLPGSRSALIAVGDAPATAGRKITLLELDQDIRFFDVFAMHPPNGSVTTLGIRADGKTIISKFIWFAGQTGAKR